MLVISHMLKKGKMLNVYGQPGLLNEILDQKPTKDKRVFVKYAKLTSKSSVGDQGWNTLPRVVELLIL